MTSSKRQNLLSRAPHRFLNRRLRKLTLSPTFKSRSHGGAFSFYALVALFLICSAALSNFNPSFFSIREFFLNLGAPIFSVLNKPLSSLSSLGRDVKNFMMLSSQLKDLQALENERDSWKAQALSLKHENELFKENFNFIKQEEENFSRFPKAQKWTYVIVSPGGIYGRRTIIEGGKNQGFSKGDTLIHTKGLVGRLVEVGEKASRALLITDMDSRVPIMLESSGHPAILAGDNTHFPQIIRLQDDMEKPLPQEGEVVFTSGVGGIFSPGVPVGTVIIKPDGNYAVSLFVDFDDLEMVGILPSYAPVLEDLSFSLEQVSIKPLKK